MITSKTLDEYSISLAKVEHLAGIDISKLNRSEARIDGRSIKIDITNKENNWNLDDYARRDFHLLIGVKLNQERSQQITELFFKLLEEQVIEKNEVAKQNFSKELL